MVRRGFASEKCNDIVGLLECIRPFIEEEARFAESQLMDLAAQSKVTMVTMNVIDALGLYTASMSASDDTRGRSPGQVESTVEAHEHGRGSNGGTRRRKRRQVLSHGNDLDTGFMAITEAPEGVYMLELPLN